MRLNGQGLRSVTCALGLMLSLAGCETMTGSKETSPAALTRLEKSDRRPVLLCGAIDPIRWSPRDTDSTILQSKAHNARWRVLCGPVPESRSDAS